LGCSCGERDVDAAGAALDAGLESLSWEFPDTLKSRMNQVFPGPAGQHGSNGKRRPPERQGKMWPERGVVPSFLSGEVPFHSRAVEAHGPPEQHLNGG